MIFSAGRRAACSNSSGVLAWHGAGWKQLTAAGTSAALCYCWWSSLQHTGWRHSHCSGTLRSHTSAKWGPIHPPELPGCWLASVERSDRLLEWHFHRANVIQEERSFAVMDDDLGRETKNWRKPLLLGWSPIRWYFHWMGTEDVISDRLSL